MPSSQATEMWELCMRFRSLPHLRVHRHVAPDDAFPDDVVDGHFTAYFCIDVDDCGRHWAA